MLETPEKIRELQRKLYQKAKQEKGYRFYLLYDKIYRLFLRSFIRLLRIIQNSFDRSMDSNCESHWEKMIGKPYMGKPYVRFEVAGNGEVLWRA